MLCEHHYFLSVFKRSFRLLQCNFVYHYIYNLSKNHCYVSTNIFSVFSNGLSCLFNAIFSITLYFEQKSLLCEHPYFLSVFERSFLFHQCSFSLSLYLHFEQNHCHVSIPIFSIFTNGLFCFFNAIFSVIVSTL